MRHALILSAATSLAIVTAFACHRTTSQEGLAASEDEQASTTELTSARMSPYQDPERALNRASLEPKDGLKAAHADMKKVLDELHALGGQSVSTFSANNARMQPTPTDAVKRVLEREGKSTEPLPMASVENRTIPGGQGLIHARIYTPKVANARKTLPIVCYWRGGGFVIGDLDTYDASARALAKNAEAIVVSLDYRRAPEHRFPAAHEDAVAGYQWVVRNAAAIGGDPKRIAVAGESAGGNLAAHVAIMARDLGETKPVHELLIYPVAQSDVHTGSYDLWAYAAPLDRASMVWFFDNYTNRPADATDPRISVVNADLAGLPKTSILLAEIDPLHSDGELLGAKLRAAGVPVTIKTYEGVTHEFFGMGAVVREAREAETWAGTQLKAAFKK